MWLGDRRLRRLPRRPSRYECLNGGTGTHSSGHLGSAPVAGASGREAQREALRGQRPLHCYMSAMRDELHHLVDQLPEADVQPAMELIRDRLAEPGQQVRNLPFFASFEADPDLAERAEEILSAELGH